VTSRPVDHVVRRLSELVELAERVRREMPEEIAAVAERTAAALAAGAKLLFCGNGGSAADAQHLAAEYVVRFQRDRRPLAAIALTTDTSLLTAAANDFGFEQVFARQVRALGRPGDILFLHSTSGRSPNLLRAAEAAREAGLVTVALLARGGGELRGLVDHVLVVPTDDGARAQEMQVAIGHIVCELVEELLKCFPST
jgi:D-sedoheptulose 7-phosphate isomerase